MRMKLNRAKRSHNLILAAVVAVAFLLAGWLCRGYVAHVFYLIKPVNSAAQTDWPAYNGAATGDHYSPLGQITTGNVGQMKEVWRSNVGTSGSVQTNPLVVGRVLYGYSSTLQVVAFDGVTGKLLWQFNSGVAGQQPSRGLTYWSDGKEAKLFAYIMNFLYALDPATGKPISTFGDDGRLDMRKDLDSDYMQNKIGRAHV